MNLHLKKPLAFFDLETTGINPVRDRIVEIAIVKVHPDGKEETKKLLVNPSVPIPIECSMIHAIYDKDVKDAPVFKEIAKEIEIFIKGCDLGGYNLVQFDIPMLVEEFMRAGIDFSLDSIKIIDAQKIFFMMEPRTLSAAYKFYCDKSLENAHSALADTVATYEVFKGQVEKYAGVELEDKNGKIYTPIKNDIGHVHQHTISKLADLAGRIIYNDDNIEVFNFGKHKGKQVEEILKKEPGYYEWMMKGDFPQYTKKVLTKIKLRNLGR